MKTHMFRGISRRRRLMLFGALLVFGGITAFAGTSRAAFVTSYFSGHSCQPFGYSPGIQHLNMGTGNANTTYDYYVLCPVSGVEEDFSQGVGDALVYYRDGNGTSGGQMYCRLDSVDPDGDVTSGYARYTCSSGFGCSSGSSTYKSTDNETDILLVESEDATGIEAAYVWCKLPD